MKTLAAATGFSPASRVDWGRSEGPLLAQQEHPRPNHHPSDSSRRRGYDG